MNRKLLTGEGYQRLQDELNDLVRKERPEITKIVSWAASLGDRSENADYIYGKRRLREIDRRLYHISKKLDGAVVVDVETVQSQAIVFGAVVELEDESGKAFVYQIVGEDEIDAEKGRMSWKSPIGKALIGKKKEDEVEVLTPSGSKYYLIKNFYFKNPE